MYTGHRYKLWSATLEKAMEYSRVMGHETNLFLVNHVKLNEYPYSSTTLHCISLNERRRELWKDSVVHTNLF